jgi:sugar/nucleoside kinase (ribokinase family)
MLDYTVELAPGGRDEKREVTSSLTSVGGTAANTAAALALLGVPVAIAGTVGDDWAGRVCADELASRGVDLACLRRCPGSTGRATIVIDAALRTVLVDRGVSERGLGRLPRAELTYVSSPAAVGDCTPSAGRLVLGIEHQMVRPSLRPLIERADLVITNSSGWEALLPFAVRVPVVETRGEHGAAIHRPGEQPALVEPCPAAVVDATGAGDAFAAGLLAALAAGASLLPAVGFAIHLGAEAVQQRGAMLRDVSAGARDALIRLHRDMGKDT